MKKGSVVFCESSARVGPGVAASVDSGEEGVSIARQYEQACVGECGDGHSMPDSVFASLLMTLSAFGDDDALLLASSVSSRFFLLRR